MEAPPKAPVSMSQTVLDLINHSMRHSPTGKVLGNQVYQLNKQDLEILDRFKHRTALTFGSNNTKWIIQAEAPRLACLHPFLMHVVLALTASHDRRLSSSDGNPTASELFHYYNATALFNYRLQCQDITPSERDAIWIASLFISAMQMCDIQAQRPEEAWPLRTSDPGEPNWLTLNLGKNDMWNLCDPTRTDSCFQVMLDKCSIRAEPEFTPYELKGDGFQNLPSEMLEYLNLDDPSTRASSPYFRAANIVSQLMPLEYNQSNIMKFITFLGLMQPEFRDLWTKKDPGVLLLLSYCRVEIDALAGSVGE
ncbi:hypothetical protein VSDG_00676 [Cytospora chrysosperma]|uniref:Transcription factor domain-containing protein n=1 Tax=Cytospora chrysosperma TaxID=252740 RepID=A0A423WQF7_CYTCH|nr:hypothetical protein VSDG_00676 [Valsa sordida]